MVKNTFETLCKLNSDKVIVRVPVIPYFNADDILKIMKYARSSGINELHLLPYHTLGVSKYKQLGMEYDFPCRESLSANTLEHFISDGEQIGLNIKIGG